MKLKLALLASILALVIVGCATESVNSSTYNTEATITDAATAATHVFNIDYVQLTSGTNPPANIAQLNATRDTFYATDKQLSAALSIVDNLRLQVVATSGTNVTVNSALTAAITVAETQLSTLNGLTNLISNLK